MNWERNMGIGYLYEYGVEYWYGYEYVETIPFS